MALLSSLGWIVVALAGVYAQAWEPGKWRHPTTPVSNIKTLCSPQPAIVHPSFVSGFLRSRFYTVHASSQVARWHLPPEFYLRCGCVSRPLTSEGLRLWPAQILWGRVSLSNGRCWRHPGTFAGLCCCRCPETAAGCQPAPEKVREIV